MAPVSEKYRQCHRLLEILIEFKKAGFVHRDIKGDNLLFKRVQRGNRLSTGICFCDGGFICAFSTLDERVPIAGTRGWIAPEYAYLRERGHSITRDQKEACAAWIEEVKKWTKSSLDVWGVGMICAYLLRRNVFELVSSLCYEERARWFQFRRIPRMYEIDPQGRDPIVQWLKKMLTPHPDARLSPEDSLKEFLAIAQA